MRAWCLCLGLASFLTASRAHADCRPPPEADGGVSDDFDNDGVPDAIDCGGGGACPDRDRDGLSDRRDPDDDNDDLLTCEERPGDVDRDTDGDGTPDYREADDDGDGIPTKDERPAGNDRDSDKDKIPDYLDADDDGDGIPTKEERPGGVERDTDKDKKPDYLDADDDGDGQLTKDEGSPTKDSDKDGIPDYLDAVKGSNPSTDGGLADGGESALDGGANGGGNGGGGLSTSGTDGIAGGGLCGVGSARASSSALWLFALALALFVRRRPWQLLSIVLALSASQASAQAPIESYRASPLPRDGFQVPRPETPGHLKWSMSVAVDYTKDAVLYRSNLAKKNSDLGAVVGTGVYGHAAFGLGIGERGAIYASIPVSLVMSGDSNKSVPTKPDGAGLMDLALGGRLVLMGEPEDAVAVAGELVLRAPTAELADKNQQFSGDAYGSAEPSLFVEGRLGRISLGGRVGARFRKPTTLLNIRSEQEMLLALAARVRIVDDVEAQLEVYGSTPFTEVLDRDRSPLEALLGVRAYTGDIHFGAAAGPGISRGLGTPQVRALALVGYAPGARASSKARGNTRPKSMGPAADVDHDGLFGDNDACPTEPEDRDGHDDLDGCPDSDNDVDGVPDNLDKCQGEREDTDDHEDGDGCPDEDNDGDHISDDADQCPDAAEDMDKLLDEDGCPEEDADEDRVPDKDDACPSDPGIPEALGCPFVMQ